MRKVLALSGLVVAFCAMAVAEVGWLGLGEMVVFIGILLVALIYLWRVGALEWGTPSQSVLVTGKEGQDALVAQ